MPTRFAAALIGLFALAGLARAEVALEILPLQHRTAEEVIPLLRPLLEPDGVLTGMRGNLILRASDANRAQIRQALAALDVAPRQLRITVRQGLERERVRQSLGVFGRVDTDTVDIRVPPAGPGGAQAVLGNGEAQIGVRLDDRSLDQVSRVTQHVRVADGGQALIHAGVDLPLTLLEIVDGPYGRTVRESVVFTRIGSGFHVAPQLVGDRVTLDIRPVQQMLAAERPRDVVHQELRTTVSVRLGEWIALGGGDAQDRQAHSRLLSKSGSASREARQVWLKVDLID